MVVHGGGELPLYEMCVCVWGGQLLSQGPLCALGCDRITPLTQRIAGCLPSLVSLKVGTDENETLDGSGGDALVVKEC